MESSDRRLLDQVRDASRLKHYSMRTEEAYVNWIKRYIYFHDVHHPAEMGAPEVQAFLSELAWGKTVDYIEYKGTARADDTTSRVLKIKTASGKTWLRLETWESRKLAHAVLSYLQAHLTASIITTTYAPPAFEQPPDEIPDRW